MRRVLDHAFSTKALREQSPLILDYVDSLIETLYEQVSGPSRGKVDLTQRYGWMSFDLIGWCNYPLFLYIHIYIYDVLPRPASLIKLCHDYR